MLELGFQFGDNGAIGIKFTGVVAGLSHGIHITIEGGECFDLFETSTRSDGLVIGQVEIQPTPPAVRLSEESQSLLDILRSLEQHPHVQRLNLRLDYNDSWQVAYALVQLLPMDEALKYELLGMADINDLAAELQVLLKQISGEN